MDGLVLLRQESLRDSGKFVKYLRVQAASPVTAFLSCVQGSWVRREIASALHVSPSAVRLLQYCSVQASATACALTLSKERSFVVDQMMLHNKWCVKYYLKLVLCSARPPHHRLLVSVTAVSAVTGAFPVQIRGASNSYACPLLFL